MNIKKYLKKVFKKTEPEEKIARWTFVMAIATIVIVNFLLSSVQLHTIRVILTG